MKYLKQIKNNNASRGKYSPDVCHDNLLGKPLYSYAERGQEEKYAELLREKFLSILGDMPTGWEPIVREESRVDKGTFIQIRLLIETEKDCVCPCLLLLPKGVEKPPVAICLQGHSFGMMLSAGEIYRFKDIKKVIEDRDFGLEAIKHGYAALLIEQRGFGERRSRVHLKGGVTCNFLAFNALLVGRTLIGERVWDVSKAIDVLQKRNDVDGENVVIMGNSGGGTASYYAACYDERIKAVMPGCSVCTYKSSIGRVYHCACNYLPGAAKFFDMGDLSCLIYPRPIVIVAGKKDPIFPLEGVRETYSIMQKVYKDKPNNLSLVIGKGAHRFYKEGWDVLDKYVFKK